jgi:hypothetical protein
MNPIPKRTLEKLSFPALPGERHAQIVEIVCALAARGFGPEAIFCQLRPNYAADVTDAEIRDVIEWANNKNLMSGAKHSKLVRPRGGSDQTTTDNCIERIRKFLNGFSCDEADLWEASPWRPLEDWRLDSLLFLAGMYFTSEQINIVTEFAGFDGKANPKGYGQTFTRDEWMRRIRDGSTPQSQAGAWIRMNPTDGRGIADKNVTACRFALIEFDKIPFSLQLSLLARLPLPINAIFSSGGKSLHAWVRVNAPDIETYRETVRKMFSLLKPFGVDQANKNPSRLSRLVGAQRIIGGSGTAIGLGKQRLLYLNPDNTKEGAIL